MFFFFFLCDNFDEISETNKQTNPQNKSWNDAPAPPPPTQSLAEHRAEKEAKAKQSLEAQQPQQPSTSQMTVSSILDNHPDCMLLLFYKDTIVTGIMLSKIKQQLNGRKMMEKWTLLSNYPPPHIRTIRR